QDSALARTVQLDEHDGLPGAEAELPGADGDRLAGAEDGRLDVRGGVPVDAVVPPHAGRYEAIERIEHVDADVRVVVLVDDHGRGRVRGLDAAEALGAVGPRDDLRHAGREINHLPLLRRPYAELGHGRPPAGAPAPSSSQ